MTKSNHDHRLGIRWGITAVALALLASNTLCLGKSIFDDDFNPARPATQPTVPPPITPPALPPPTTAPNVPIPVAPENPVVPPQVAPAPAPVIPPRPVLLPIPNATEQAAAERILRQVYHAEYARRARADHAALAQTFLHESEKSQYQPAEKFVMLREARDLSAQAVAPDVTLAAVRQMSLIFAIDFYTAQADALSKLNKAAQMPEQRLTVAKACAALLDEAKTVGKYLYLNHVAAIADAIASHCPDGILAARLRRQAREGRAFRVEFERAAVAAHKFEKDPSDGASAKIAGLFLCLMHGDWASGLPMLAHATDVRTRAVAGLEVAVPSNPDVQVSAGDAWVDVSKGETALMKLACEERAAFWYSKAIHDSSGLARETAVRKFESLSGHPPFTAIATAIRSGKAIKTSKIGGGGGGEFEDTPPDGAILVGFTTTQKGFAGHTIVGSIQPIWKTAGGRLEGQKHGPGGDNETTIEAEPGYAVGAIIARGGDRLDGFEFVFMKIRPNGMGLDPTDSYESQWVGGLGGAKPAPLGGDGKFIVGFYGFTGSDFDSVGLVEMC